MALKSPFDEYLVIESFEVRLHSVGTKIFAVFFFMSLCGLILSNSAIPGVDIKQNLLSFSSDNASIQPAPKSNYIDELNWLYTFLSLNLFLSCFPRLFWKFAEGGLVKRLTNLVNTPRLSRRSQKYHAVMLRRYLLETRGTHGVYLFKCIIAEFCTFVCAICQVFFIKSIFCLKISKYAIKTASHFNFPARCSAFVGCANSYGIFMKNFVREMEYDSVLRSYIDYMETWIFFGFLSLFFIITNATLYLVMRRIQGVFHPELLAYYHKGYRKSLTSQYLASDWFLLDLLKNNMDPCKFRIIVNELEIDLSKKYE